MQKFFHSVPKQSGWRVVDPHILLLRQDIWLNTELAVFFTKNTLGPFRKQSVMRDSPPSTLTAPLPHRKKNCRKNNWIVPLLKKKILQARWL